MEEGGGLCIGGHRTAYSSHLASPEIRRFHGKGGSPVGADFSERASVRDKAAYRSGHPATTYCGLYCTQIP